MNTEHKRLWPYRQAIRVTIARFCTGVYMPNMVTNLLEWGMGIPRHEIRHLSTLVTDQEIRVSLWDGTERVIPLTDVEPFTRHGCSSCNDYLGETADIAVGTLGALPGHATLVTRTLAGDAVVQNACSFGLLETIAQVDEMALNAAKGEMRRTDVHGPRHLTSSTS